MTDLPITDPIAAIVARVSAEKMDPTPEDYVRAGMGAETSIAIHVDASGINEKYNDASLSRVMLGELK